MNQENLYEMLRKKHDETDWDDLESIKEYNEYARRLRNVVAMHKIDEYVEAVRAVLKTNGLEAANVANHLALENELVSYEMFAAAARVLAEQVLLR